MSHINRKDQGDDHLQPGQLRRSKQRAVNIASAGIRPVRKLWIVRLSTMITLFTLGVATDCLVKSGRLATTNTKTGRHWLAYRRLRSSTPTKSVNQKNEKPDPFTSSAVQEHTKLFLFFTFLFTSFYPSSLLPLPSLFYLPLFP